MYIYIYIHSRSLAGVGASLQAVRSPLQATTINTPTIRIPTAVALHFAPPAPLFLG